MQTVNENNCSPQLIVGQLAYNSSNVAYIIETIDKYIGECRWVCGTVQQLDTAKRALGTVTYNSTNARWEVGEYIPVRYPDPINF